MEMKPACCLTFNRDTCFPSPPFPAWTVPIWPPLVQQLVHNSAALFLASVPHACELGECTLASSAAAAAAAAGFPPFRIVPINSNHTSAATLGCCNGEHSAGLSLFLHYLSIHLSLEQVLSGHAFGRFCHIVQNEHIPGMIIFIALVVGSFWEILLLPIVSGEIFLVLIALNCDKIYNFTFGSHTRRFSGSFANLAQLQALLGYKPCLIKIKGQSKCRKLTISNNAGLLFLTKLSLKLSDIGATR